MLTIAHICHHCPLRAGLRCGATQPPREFSAHVNAAICPKNYFNDPPPPRVATPAVPQRVPAKDWPFWANRLSRRKSPADAGVGDTLHRILGKVPMNLRDRAKRAMSDIGVPCGCDARRAEWNVMYGYETET